MSVLIKGMKMPKSCDSCDLIQFDDEGLEAHCPLSPYYRWCGTPPDYRPEEKPEGVIEYRYDGRPDNCPLVEIPTPHGRLIDADELLRQPMNTANYPKNYVHVAPTIIEAEVSENA